MLRKQIRRDRQSIYLTKLYAYRSDPLLKQERVGLHMSELAKPGVAQMPTAALESVQHQTFADIPISAIND